MLIAVLDWETTGLTLHPQADLSQQPRAIEFGGLLTDGSLIADTCEFICNPGMEIEPIITKITGLTNEDLAKEGPFAAHSMAFESFIRRADCVIAHNLSFDKAIAHVEAQLLGKTLENMGWPKMEICTVEQTFPMFGRRMKLQELYELKCGPYVQKHRAIDDVKLLHEVCLRFGVYDAILGTQS